MNRLRIALAIIIVLCLVKHFQPSSAPKPINPPDTDVVVTTGSLRVLVTYDPKNKGEYADVTDSTKFRALLDRVCKKDGDVPAWRIVPVGTVFNSDQPEFQSLMAQKRDSDFWITGSNGRLRGDFSVPLPKSEAEAETLIGKYAR